MQNENSSKILFSYTLSFTTYSSAVHINAYKKLIKNIYQLTKETNKMKKLLSFLTALTLLLQFTTFAQQNSPSSANNIQVAFPFFDDVEDTTTSSLILANEM